jgi:hypothetical protein
MKHKYDDVMNILTLKCLLAALPLAAQVTPTQLDQIRLNAQDQIPSQAPTPSTAPAKSCTVDFSAFTGPTGGIPKDAVKDPNFYTVTGLAGATAALEVRVRVLEGAIGRALAIGQVVGGSKAALKAALVPPAGKELP